MAAPLHPLPPLSEVDEPFSPDLSVGARQHQHQLENISLMGRGQSAPHLANLSTSSGRHPLAKRRKSTSPMHMSSSDSCSALDALDAMSMAENDAKNGSMMHDGSMHGGVALHVSGVDEGLLLPVPHAPGYESPVMMMFGSTVDGDAADDALVATGMAQLPDVMLTNVFGFLGRDIIRSCAICRKWRYLCTMGLDTTNLVPMSVLEEQEGNNPLRVRGAPHYAGRVVLRNDLYACWRAVSPSDLATWEIVPKSARRFILTHASLHEIFAGPELRAAEWMELIAARFTSSMLPNQLSPVQSGRHYFFQALMQEELQLEAFARFSAFNSLLPLTDISLNFRVDLLVVDAENRGGQVRQVSHCGFNLPACVFANYNFSAMGAGERARMMYFSDMAGDEDSMDWFDHVPKPMDNRQLADAVPDFTRRWNAIKDIDVYSISNTDPFATDDDFEFYEDRLVRVSWRGRFAVCFWFRLGFCQKAGVTATNVNRHAAELLSTTLGGADWARYPQYHEAYKRERLDKLRFHPDGDKGQIVGKTVVFGGIARDVYNNDDYNVSFGCGQQLVVMPLSLSDLDAFKSDIAASGGAQVEVYGNNACIANSDVNRLQGYDHANIEQMVWHVNI